MLLEEYKGKGFLLFHNIFNINYMMLKTQKVE